MKAGFDVLARRGPYGGMGEQGFGHSGKITACCEEARLKRGEEFGIGAVGDKMHCEFACQMRRCRRMARKIAQHGLHIIDIRVLPTVGAAQHRFAAWLGHVLAKVEAHGFGDRDSRKQLGKFAHIDLGIGATHAQRVQLHDFTGEVFVHIRELAPL